MTTQYAEEQGFKKKYLAPLIVLMLCAVSLTGAAYAYSTTVTGNGTISGDYYTIDMYDTDGNVITESITSDDYFEVQTTKTVGKTYFASTVADKTYTDAGTGKKYIQIDFIEKVMVQSSKADTETTPVKGVAEYNNQNTDTGALYSPWNSTTVKCTVGFDKDGTGAYDLKAINFNELYFMKITVLLPLIENQDTKISGLADDGSTNADLIAEYLNFNGKDCLTITLTATDN